MSNANDVHQAVRYRIARRVRKLRSDSRLTQERLAQLSGLAPRHLQKVEAAAVNVTLESLVKIANALGVDVSELFIEDHPG